MTLATIPDIERVLGDYLRTHPSVAPLARVSGTLPKSFTSAWVKIVQLDAAHVTPSLGYPIEHLIAYLLQVDAYAGAEHEGGQAEASALGRTVRAALYAARGQVLAGVTISSVRVVSDARIPDQAFEPWRERRILTVQIYAHA